MKEERESGAAGRKKRKRERKDKGKVSVKIMPLLSSFEYDSVSSGNNSFLEQCLLISTVD